MRTAATLGVVTLLLAGCMGAPRLYNQHVSHAYTATAYGYGAGRRDFLTIVRGDPFGQGPAAFEDAIIETLQRHPPRPQPTNFTTTPGESARESHHAVFVFDAPAAVLGSELCATPPRVPVVPLDGVVRVAAAFCRGSGALTQVTGEVAAPSGADDPQVDALIGQVVAALFPIDNPDDDDDGVILIPD